MGQRDGRVSKCVKCREGILIWKRSKSVLQEVDRERVKRAETEQHNFTVWRSISPLSQTMIAGVIPKKEYSTVYVPGFSDSYLLLLLTSTFMFIFNFTFSFIVQ